MSVSGVLEMELVLGMLERVIEAGRRARMVD